MPINTASSLCWGVLGTGRITRKVAPALRDTPGHFLRAVASRDLRKAQDWNREFRADRYYEGYQCVLDDPGVDAVYIALPPSLHAEWTIRAAQAGKHVLCEKPLAPTLSEARAMATACREAGVALWDGMMWPHHPRTAQIREILESGELGEVCRVTSAFSFLGDKLPADDFRFQSSFGGGSLLDLGWYCLGISLWAISAEVVESQGISSLRNDVDLSFSGQLRFGNGATAGFDCGYLFGPRRWVEIACERGSIVCDDFTRPWQPEKVRFWVHQSDGSSREIRSPNVGVESAMVHRFGESIRSLCWQTAAELPLRIQQTIDGLISPHGHRQSETP